MQNNYNKPYFGNGSGWGSGWGMFNPFAKPAKDPFNPLTNGGIQGLTPEILQRLKDDFANADLETKAKMWSNDALQPYFMGMLGGDKDLINQIERASWTAGGMDVSQYGLNQMRLTEVAKARNAARYGSLPGGAAPTTFPGGGYNPTYNPIPAGGSNPYPDYTQLYRDPGGMIHDFGDNPAPTTPTTPEIPWQGHGSNIPPWMGYGMGRQRRHSRGGGGRNTNSFGNSGTSQFGFTGRTDQPPVSTVIEPDPNTRIPETRPPAPPPSTYVDPTTGFIPGYSQQ